MQKNFPPEFKLNIHIDMCFLWETSKNDRSLGYVHTTVYGR